MKGQDAKYFAYLDELRENGDVNMYGTTPYLMAEFPNLKISDAQKILFKWMLYKGEVHNE